MFVMENIYNKIKQNKRLTIEEGISLYKNADLITLGQLANAKREALHGNNTYYVRNLHIDYSNICALSCKFCAYSRKSKEEGGFELSIEDVLNKIRKHANHDIQVVHIVGGHHPKLPYDYYLNMLKSIKEEFPKIHIRAFTACEINYLSKKFGFTEEKVLKDFMACGLGSLPGGGAEILVDNVRQEICGPKGSSETWLSTHRLAHSLGLKTNVTMLYGLVECLEDSIFHMSKIRDLQDETKGFTSFIPLAFNPKNTFFENLDYTTGHDNLRTIAISRLFLDNIPHIKAYWVMSGMAMAQIAQHFGADDLHGTVIEEHITQMAGGLSPQEFSVLELTRHIEGAGREAVER